MSRTEDLPCRQASVVDMKTEDRISRTLYVKINHSQLPCVTPITERNFRLHFQDFDEDIQSSPLMFNYGFVTFRSRAVASLAMERLDGTMLCGRHKLDISFKRNPKSKEAGPVKIKKRTQAIKSKGNATHSGPMLSTSSEPASQSGSIDSAPPVIASTSQPSSSTSQPSWSTLQPSLNTSQPSSSTSQPSSIKNRRESAPMKSKGTASESECVHASKTPSDSPIKTKRGTSKSIPKKTKREGVPARPTPAAMTSESVTTKATPKSTSSEKTKRKDEYMPLSSASEPEAVSRPNPIKPKNANRSGSEFPQMMSKPNTTKFVSPVLNTSVQMPSTAPTRSSTGKWCASATPMKGSTSESAQTVSTASTRPVVKVVEFKDEDIGLMFMEGKDGSLSEVAKKECVDIRPVQVPRRGFQIKGDLKNVETVVGEYNKLCALLARSRIGYEQIVLNNSCGPAFTHTEVEQFRKGLKKDLRVLTSCSFESLGCCQRGLRVAQDHVVVIKMVVGDLLTEQADAIVIPTGRAVGTDHSYPIELGSLCGKIWSLENSSRELVEVGHTDILDGGKLPCSYIIQALFPRTSADKDSCDVTVRNSLSLATRMNLGSISFPGLHTSMARSIVDGLSSLGPTSLHTITIVLQSFEESIYKAAFEIELKKKSSVEDTSAATSTPPIALTWSWRENDGSFTPYGPAATETLNKSYQKDTNGTCDLVINGVHYSIDFSTMKQINMSTSNQRSVATNASPNYASSHVLNPESLRWRYRDDYGRFMSYSTIDSVKIEAMFQKQDELSEIIVQKRAYRFDFKQMKQVNVHTRFKRDIQRTATQKSMSSPVVTVPSKLVFLSDEKMVVNLKGPRENITKAKKELEKKIKALMYCKEVPLPATVPSSLHQQLQAIAKQHTISCIAGEGVSNEASIAHQHALKLEGLESCVKGALLEVQELIIQFQATNEVLAQRSTVQGSNQFPKEWDVMSDTDSVKIVPLPMLAEHQKVGQKFRQTMPDAHIINIQRVQNKELWNRYVQCMTRIHEKNPGRVNEKFLFHGTRGEPAEKICRSEEGFDVRFSREGMWGKANYFAVNAGYSDTYSHQDGANGTREMILARVLTGDSYFSPSDSTLKMPPEKHQHSTGENQLQQVRYDSVKGKTSGSVVYMTYSNDRAYPAYIITYSRTQSAGHSWYSQAAGHSQTARHTGYMYSQASSPSATGSPSSTNTSSSSSSATSSQGHASSGDCVVL